MGPKQRWKKYFSFWEPYIEPNIFCQYSTISRCIFAKCSKFMDINALISNILLEFSNFQQFWWEGTPFSCEASLYKLKNDTQTLTPIHFYIAGSTAFSYSGPKKTEKTSCGWVGSSSSLVRVWLRSRFITMKSVSPGWDS